jgi:hypothetical protein
MGNIHIGPIYHLYSLNYAIDFLGVLDISQLVRIIFVALFRFESCEFRVQSPGLKKKTSHAMSIKRDSQQQRLKNEIGTHICIQEINIQ